MVNFLNSLGYRIGDDVFHLRDVLYAGICPSLRKGNLRNRRGWVRIDVILDRARRRSRSYDAGGSQPAGTPGAGTHVRYGGGWNDVGYLLFEHLLSNRTALYGSSYLGRHVPNSV